MESFGENSHAEVYQGLGQDTAAVNPQCCHMTLIAWVLETEAVDSKHGCLGDCTTLWSSCSLRLECARPKRSTHCHRLNWLSMETVASG